YDSDGTALVYLLNPGGGVLQHDRLHTEIVLEEGSSAVITTPSGTKLYRMDEGYAKIKNEFVVGEGGILEYLPEHNVPFADSTTYQENEFRLKESAILFATDMVTPGRVSRDECFQYDLYSTKTKIYVEEELILYDHSKMQPKEQDLSGIGMLEGYQATGTFFAYAKGMSSQVREAIHQMDTKVYLAAGNITPDLLVVRLLGNNIMDMQKAMLGIWEICRKEIIGKESVRIRKY
ncbi:MAG: urease accessory protein UreD, partial [Anaerovoracaceae bacterium]